MNDKVEKTDGSAGEIVLYQPDEKTRLEVRVDADTVWLSQQQMSQLFGTNRQAITKHLKNIYDTEELARESTSSILELVQQEGSGLQHQPSDGGAPAACG